MGRYEISYKHIVQRCVTVLVEAENDEGALKEARDGNVSADDEVDCEEDSLELTDFRIVKRYLDKM